jgi:hypothetical protein
MHNTSSDAGDDDMHSDQQRRPGLIAPARDDDEPPEPASGPPRWSGLCKLGALIGGRHDAEACGSTVPLGDRLRGCRSRLLTRARIRRVQAPRDAVPDTHSARAITARATTAATTRPRSPRRCSRTIRPAPLRGVRSSSPPIRVRPPFGMPSTKITIMPGKPRTTAPCAVAGMPMTRNGRTRQVSTTSRRRPVTVVRSSDWPSRRAAHGEAARPHSQRALTLTAKTSISMRTGSQCRGYPLASHPERSHHE